MRRPLVRIIVMVLLAATCSRPAEKPVRVVATGEVADVGLVQMLGQRFSSASGVPLRIERAGVTPVLQTNYSRFPAVIVTTDPAVVQGLGTQRRLSHLFARDEFLIIGPSNDPAGVKGAATAAAAFRRIAERDRAFCSPVDIAAWLQRENELWAAAAVDPKGSRRHRPCHGDVAQVIRDTAARRGYTLIHASAASTVAKSRLAVVASGIPGLRTDYWIVLAAGRKPAKNAQWFVEWTMSRAARQMVGTYRLDGETRFTSP